MKVAIELPEKEIAEMAKQLVAKYVADKVIESSFGDGKFYRNTIKEVVRETIRSDIDNLSERAVNAASKSIENRAVKKALDILKAEDGT